MNRLGATGWMTAVAALVAAVVPLPGRAAAQDGGTPLGASASGQTVLGADVGRIEARLLTGVRIVGADLVEVSPPFDPSGGTAFLGVSLMFEMLCAIAATHA